MIEHQYQLIQRAMAGESEAFAELLRQTQNMVYNLAYRITGNREDAFDISQETFIKVWRALPKFRFECNFSTWVYRIAANTAKDHLRKECDRTEVISDLEKSADTSDESLQPEKQIMKKEQATEVKQALDRLTPEHREIIVLREVEGYSYEEIAEILGLELGTVKSRISRARTALCRLLDENVLQY